MSWTVICLPQTCAFHLFIDHLFVNTRIGVRDGCQAHLFMISKNPASCSTVSKNPDSCACPPTSGPSPTPHGRRLSLACVSLTTAAHCSVPWKRIHLHIIYKNIFFYDLNDVCSYCGLSSILDHVHYVPFRWKTHFVGRALGFLGIPCLWDEGFLTLAHQRMAIRGQNPGWYSSRPPHILPHTSVGIINSSKQLQS